MSKKRFSKFRKEESQSQRASALHSKDVWGAFGAPVLVLAIMIFSQLGTVWGQVELQAFDFSDDRTIRFPLVSTERAAGANAKAEVDFEEGQSRLELEYDDLKPAVLFGGDITVYVVWAIGRDGAWENLGELAVSPDDRSDTVRFSTGLRTFGLLVTAEPYYEAAQPSDLVLFYSQGPADPPLRGTSVTFADFAETPAHGVENLEAVAYDSEKPVELIQAERVFEQAEQMGSPDYASEIFQDAERSLLQARTAYDRSGSDAAVGYARRSFSAANDAIRLTRRRKALERIEARVQERRAQMETLQSQMNELREEVQEAEDRIEEIRNDRERVESELSQARSELERVEQERAVMRSELADLREERDELEGALDRLQEQRQELQREKATLQDRLQSALSEVAETRETARGYLVNLPDILFDVGEATLKQPAIRALSKLAGILLIMDELEVKIEGHTDSTGSPSLNRRLSRQRADSVFDLLVEEGVNGRRLETEGFGSQKPVATNETREGRQKNRRVELIISENAASP